MMFDCQRFSWWFFPGAHESEHMSDTKNFEVITAAAERLRVSPGWSYRTWSREEKDRIVGETFALGANVSVIARSHGLDPSQLFAWRRKALASGLVAPVEAPGIGGLTTCG